MSKIIYIYSKKTFSEKEEIFDKLKKICSELEPDNIKANKPIIHVGKNVAYAVINPTIDIKKKGDSVLLGTIFGEGTKWNEINSEFPDGSYALFRKNKEFLEIVSDFSGSRTIWIYRDSEILISSTSQRAIIMFLEEFEFDNRVIPWILSSGTLGPIYSWDKRIKRITPDSSVILDIRKWEIKNKNGSVKFETTNKKQIEYEKSLMKSLKNTFRLINIKISDWKLPLSGGYDSRAILCFLIKSEKHRNNIETITWGIKSSQKVKHNDAYIAKELANALGVKNKFYTTDLGTESPDIILERFIKLSEGRTDQLAGYMDGMRIWKLLFEDGVKGIIRGDEGFGWINSRSSFLVRLNSGFVVCDDFVNLKDYQKFGFPKQIIPQQFLQKNLESLSDWRDRLYHEFRLPVSLSALSDIKYSYVEVINPLLSKRILQVVRVMPERLRTQKFLFKKVVNSICPKVDYAKSGANQGLNKILKERIISDYLLRSLKEMRNDKIIPVVFFDYVMKGIKKDTLTTRKGVSNHMIEYIKNLIPRFIKNKLKESIIENKIDSNLLAFRLLIIYRMFFILNKDKKLFK